MTYTPRNAGERMTFLAYQSHLNRHLESDETPIMYEELLQDIEYMSAYDLNEEGYSLADQITFDYNGVPVSLISFFEHDDQADRSAGIHLTLVMLLHNEETPRIIYSIDTIERILL